MAITDEAFLQALPFTLGQEGGYVNNPNDPGGATNHGITQSVYDTYRANNGLPPQSVIDITAAEYEDIYYNNYWLTADCQQMQAPLCLAQFDTAVNFGVAGAARLLQQALGVVVDGIIGPNTLAASEQSDPTTVASKICDLRIQFRYNRVQEHPSQSVFLQGWLNRDNSLKKLCETA